MKSNHNPSLEDRLAGAAKSRQKALDALRSKPPVDEKVVAARHEARLKRDAAHAEKRNAKSTEAAAAKQAKAHVAAEAATVPAPSTGAELKAARDARYAARKTRK
ncbi:MAG: hypothetical protein H0W65_05485 [Sphingomonas sp.]|uniref:DUF6481 family protein n=1 Tax=Sphingomonas sp. TaxID=28214 RepID=UPI0017D56B86|nr:DUF6481 family protein [Sphingomonas sp.]MBA3667155.1 hypothetical protein [Sphingomonas sp.]